MASHHLLSPSMVPAISHSSRVDVINLHEAIKGFKCDEKIIIEVLTSHTHTQRLEISEQYKEVYGRDLIEDFKSKTSGSFQQLLIAMLQPFSQYYAKELHRMISDFGDIEHLIIEIVYTQLNRELNRIQNSYKEMYDYPLYEDLTRDVVKNKRGWLRKSMIYACLYNKNETSTVNPDEAEIYARNLQQSGEIDVFNEQSIFKYMLYRENVAQIELILNKYRNITGCDIEETIKSKCSKNTSKITISELIDVVECIQKRPTYFATRLYGSLKNKSKFFAKQLYRKMTWSEIDHKSFIRIIVTRSDIDKEQIKTAFFQKYKQTLHDFICDHCSGHYQECLIALIS